VFGPVKAAHRDQVERLERGGVGTIGKQHFTYLNSPAREKAFSKKDILAGWAKSGSFPMSPERVLKDTPKPISEPAIPVPNLKICEVDVCLQGEVLQRPLHRCMTELNRMLVRKMR
jgi:hypothetical protein